MFPRLFIPTLLLAFPVAQAGDYIGTAHLTNEMYRVNAATGQTTLIGAYTLASAEEFTIPVLARGIDGKLYGISSSVANSRIYRFDESNGQATAVSVINSGPVSPAGAVIDPANGEIYFTNTFGFVPWPQMYRTVLATGQTQFLGNIGPTIQDDQNGLALTPNGNLYSLNRSKKSLWKIDKTDPLNGSGSVGSLGAVIDLSNGGTLFYDAALQSLVAFEFTNARLFQVNATTGLATLISGPGTVSPLLLDLEVTGCGDAVEYGLACAGSGGFLPHLAVEGCPQAGSQLSLHVTNGLGGSSALILFGLTPGAVPIGLGCFVYVTPILPAMISVPLSGAGPGAGSVLLTGTLPAAAAGVSFTTQALTIDPGVPLGAAASNGMFIQVP